MVEKLKRFTARSGEPLVGALPPERMPEILGEIGFELLENLSAAQQEERYFANRGDVLRPMPASFFAHARSAKSST